MYGALKTTCDFCYLAANKQAFIIRDIEAHRTANYFALISSYYTLLYCWTFIHPNRNEYSCLNVEICCSVTSQNHNLPVVQKNVDIFRLIWIHQWLKLYPKLFLKLPDPLVNALTTQGTLYASRMMPIHRVMCV